MKKLWVIIILSTLCFPVQAAVFSGGVEKTGLGTGSLILDAETNQPVEAVKISVPKKNFTTYTDENGRFTLSAKADSPMIMSIEKEGYRPYSITLDKSTNGKPIVVSIEKSMPGDIIINSGWQHLGDNSYSSNSANCADFHEKASGAFYSQNFQIPIDKVMSRYYLVIGSIIGIDSLMAQKMGQNKIKSSYATPPEIFLNGIKIANIELNGDAQRFELPKNLIRRGTDNEVTIKTGKNMASTSRIDYDDIEFINLSVISE